MGRHSLRYWPEELAQLQAVSIEAMERSLRRFVSLPDRKHPPDGGPAGLRPIRLRFPPSLWGMLKRLRGEKKVPKVEGLLIGAEWYREKHPVEPDWQAPGDRFENQDQELTTRVLMFHWPERELLQDLGRGVTGVTCRREAFECVAAILEERWAEIPDRSEETRRMIKMSLPPAVEELAATQVARGWPLTTVLLAAAQSAIARGDVERDDGPAPQK